MDQQLLRYVDMLFIRYPILAKIRKNIIDAYILMEKTFEDDGKLLIAGNGGSAADSEHIAGELMKQFKIPRPISLDYVDKLKAVDP